MSMTSVNIITILSRFWLRCADVIRFHMGPTVGTFAQVLVALSLAGIGIAQARGNGML